MVKKRQKIMLYAFILAIIWAYSITVFSTSVSTIPFYIQFFMVSVIAYTFPSLILGQSFLDSIGKRTIGTLLFLMACDLVLPPLIVNLDGTTSSVLLGTASPDYFFSQLWGSVGLTGPLLFFMTYPVTFFILVVISIRLLSTKQLKGMAE